MSGQTTIFFTGATGFIGGSVLNLLLEHPRFTSFDITAVVRSLEKAEKLKTLGVNAVIGSNEDELILEDGASKADIVMNIAGDWLAPTKALLRGSKTRYDATGNLPIFIHISGTGVFVDNALGQYASEVIYSDMDIEKIEALDPKAVHRDAEIAVVDADNEGYLKTYIVSPSNVYGHVQNKLVDMGIQSDTNLLLPVLYSTAMERGQMGVIGPGKSLFGLVDNSELAQLFILLLDEALANPSKAWHGREGYYIASEGEFTWAEFLHAFAEGLVKAGKLSTPEIRPFTQAEMETHFTHEYLTVFGGNTRTSSDRSKALGWKPTSTKEKLLQNIRSEGERLGKLL